MLGSSYKVATVWGIPIKIHISLLVLLAVFAVTIGISGGPRAVLMVLLLETCIFASIALHELGHSFVAIRKGCRVREITLMFIGGAAQMEEIPRRPRDEFLMAVAGPAVSVALGALCVWGGGYLPLRVEAWPLPIVRRLVICNVVQYLGLVNFGLAVFNLLPAFPMDGGRVLRAALAARLGRLRATFVAARVGRIVAVLFGVWAFYHHSWLLAVIAFFIFVAAGNEYNSVRLQEMARTAGFGPWPPGGDGGDDDPGDGQVVISPPPYERGPGTRTQVRAARRWPFGMGR